jgi:hypothetical protein
VKPKESLQSIIDSFVRSIGGQLVSDLIDNNNPPMNADYRFFQHGVIAELKSLEEDSFGESQRQRIGRLMRKWEQEGRFIVLGRAKVDTQRLPVECQHELSTLLAEPFKTIVSRANRQIAMTKEIPAVGLPIAKGLLWVASDGNETLRPDMVWYLLTRILLKRHSDGTLQYSDINAVAYFNPRMLASMPQSDEPTLFWFSAWRDSTDESLGAFLKLLCDSWLQHVEKEVRGVKIRRATEISTPDGFGFYGIAPRMPFVDISEP